MQIPLRIRLSAPLAKIKDEIANYPNFRPLRCGTVLKYNLLGQNDEVIYNVEISRDSLVLEILSRYSPLYGLRSSLNIVLGMCTILKDYISVDFDSIMPYMAYELNREQIAKYEVPNNRNQVHSYLVLAKRINNLLSKNNELGASLEKLEIEISRLVSYVLIFESLHRTVSFAEIAGRYKIDMQRLGEVSGKLPEYGYRMMKINKEKFTVVDA